MENINNNNTSESAPLIVEVTNTTAEKHNVRVFFPNEKKEDNYGNHKGIELRNAGIDVQIGDTTIKSPTYDDLLSVIDKKKITVGMTYMQAVINNAQPFQPYIIHSEHLISGRYSGFKILPFLDPYQNQCSVSLSKRPYVFDNINGYSGMILPVLPNAKFYIYLFPSSILGTTSEDVQEEQSKNYGVPDLIRSNVSIVAGVESNHPLTEEPIKEKNYTKTKTQKKNTTKKSTSKK